VVDAKCHLAQIVIQDFLLQSQGEISLVAKSGEGNHINISRWPKLLCLNILTEAAIYPLEAIIDTRLMKMNSELKPATQYGSPLLCVAEPLAKGQSIRAIGSAIS